MSYVIKIVMMMMMTYSGRKTPEIFWQIYFMKIVYLYNIYKEYTIFKISPFR